MRKLASFLVVLACVGTLFSCQYFSNYTVTYNGNGNTSGSAPTDGGSYAVASTVTVLGNTGSLAKTGYTFAGWNTTADGSGTPYAKGTTFTMGTANVTLYAMWNSNTASLASMVVADSNGTTYDPSPTFDPTTYSYGVTSLGQDDQGPYTLTLATTDSHATITSVSEAVYSSTESGVVASGVVDSHTGSVYTLQLRGYENYVTIVVTAQDGTVSHYWIYVKASWNG